MKAKIFSFVPVRDTSMIASVRIANYVHDRTGYDVDWEDTIADGKLDLLVIVNGAYSFCRQLPALAEAVLKARRIVWVQNDFTIVPPKITSEGTSPFRAAFRERHKKKLPHMDFWTTCEKWSRLTPESLYVNWNMLTFDPKYTRARAEARQSMATPDLLYYGSFRDNRRRYFDRYFATPEVDVTISSPSKKFRENYGSARIMHLEPFREKFFDELGSHGLGLYIEDRQSHTDYHSPANRFYEMLSAGLPMVFQPESGTMLRKAGFDPEPYFARNAREVKSMMARREEIGVEQRKKWVGSDAKKFRRMLDEQFDAAHQATLDTLR